MSYETIRSSKPVPAALSILLLASIGLTACGGSSTKSTTNTTATSAASTATSGSSGATGPRGPGAGRFTALRECLSKNGITLPKRTPGQRPGAAGGFLGGGAAAGGPQLPKGVTRAQYEAALKKCGGHVFAGGRGAGRFANRFNSPAFKAALTKYAECLRQNGVNISAPNTSGRGPIFDTKGINTASAQFKAATTKCRSALTGAFRAHPGATKTG